MCMKHEVRNVDDVTRRAFLAGTLQACLGVGMMPLFRNLDLAAAAEPDPIATARSVIYIYLSGGMSHLDTFDTKPGAETQGPVESLSTTADGVQVSQYFPLLSRQMDKVAVINSMHSTQGAHPQARYFLHTGYDLRGTIKHPSMGAWAVKLAGPGNPTLPPHIEVGGQQYTASAGFFDSAAGPLPIGDPSQGLANGRLPAGVSEKEFSARLTRLQKLNASFRKRFATRDVRSHEQAYEQAVRLMRSRDLAAFDIAKEKDSVRDAYGRNRFGQGLLLARRLVEHRVRFIEVVSNGWDTHNENFDALEAKCPELDRGLAALLADLDARGLLDETLVVVATEFGRTPKITTGRNGRDHFPKAFTCLLAGGGIKRGIRYGRTDELGMNVIENPVGIPELNATIAQALGLPIDKVLYSPSGRPFTVSHKGKPVMELFA